MRVSVFHDDHGYRPDAVWYEVLLNGEKVPDCMTADDIRGEVVVSRRDIHDQYIPGEYDTLYGKVDILKPKAA